MNRELTYISLGIILACCGSIGCKTGQSGGDVGKTKDVEAQLILKEGKVVRVEKFKKTWNLKGFGPVKYACKATPCTEGELGALSLDDAKRPTKIEQWNEFREVELPDQDKVPEADRKRKSILNMSGVYAEGARDGEWKTFTEDGKVLRTTAYVKGKKHGLEKKFNPSGNVIEQKNYAEDVLDGPYFKKTVKELLQIEGNYKAGKMAGAWKVYFVTPKAPEEPKKDGEKPDPKAEDKPAAADVAPKPEDENAPNQLSSAAIKYETMCENDLKTGTYKGYNHDGKVTAEGPYVNGARNGMWKLYFPDGVVQSEGRYAPAAGLDPEKCSYEATGETPPGKPGHKRVGVWKAFYPSGKIFSEGESDGAKSVGVWSFYSSKGIKRFEGKMRNALMMDEGKVWDPKGQMLGEGKFFFTVLTMNKDLELNDSFKPTIPFTYYNSKGGKWLAVTKSTEKAGEIEATEYAEDGSMLGTGPVVATTPPKKNGCWMYQGKKVYFMLNNVNEKAGKQMGCK